MSVRSAQSITVLFTTRVFSTGVGTNADSLPAGTLYVNGVANAATVTVANLATGVYTAAVTLPALAVGDVVDLRIAATVGSVADSAVIWRDGKDVLLNAAGKTTDAVQTGDSFGCIGAAGAGLTALGDARIANLDAAVSSRSTYAGADTAGTTTLLARLTAGRATGLDNLDATVSSRSTYAGADTGGTTTLLARLTAGRATSLDNLDAAVSSRLATAGYTAPANPTDYARNNVAPTWYAAPLDAAGVRGAVGLGGANLDAQLAVIASYIDTEVAAIKAKTDQLAFTVAGHVDATASLGGNVTVGGYAAGQDPATLVLDAAATDHNTAGTVGQRVNAAGGASDPLANPLGGYASGTAGGALQHLGTASVAVTSPVVQGGDVSVIQGDSYLALDNRAIEWTDAGGTWPDLAGATALLILHASSGSQALGLAVVTPSGAGKRLRLELTAGASGGMASRTTPYSIRAALADGSTVTLSRGNWTVLPY